MYDNDIINPEIGNLFKKISGYTRTKFKLIVVLFLIGLSAGIPLAHYVVNWLLDSTILPNDVDIVVLTPVELSLIHI